MADKKISQLTAKAAGLAATDLIEISESDGAGGYVSKSVTGTNVLGTKQDTLVSGTNIKTINSSSILGSGDLAVTTSPSGVAGAIQFSDGSAFSSDATNLSFDDTNDRLGVGQSTPTARVHIKGSGATNATTSLLVHNSGDVASLQCTDDLSVFSHGKGAVATNTVYGKGALLGGTVTGANNVAIGVNALATVTTGAKNTAIGSGALDLITTGFDNTAVGYNSLTAATSASAGNTAIGSEALRAVTSGSTNTGVGNLAGLQLSTGSSNIAIGYGQTFQASGSTTGTIMIGVSDTATGSNQCRFGSASVTAGAVTTEVVAQAKTWSVFINGTAHKILLA